MASKATMVSVTRGSARMPVWHTRAAIGASRSTRPGSAAPRAEAGMTAAHSPMQSNLPATTSHTVSAGASITI
jgi:hypothetical protein